MKNSHKAKYRDTASVIVKSCHSIGAGGVIDRLGLGTSFTDILIGEPTPHDAANAFKRTKQKAGRGSGKATIKLLDFMD